MSSFSKQLCIKKSVKIFFFFLLFFFFFGLLFFFCFYLSFNLFNETILAAQVTEPLVEKLLQPGEVGKSIGGRADVGVDEEIAGHLQSVDVHGVAVVVVEEDEDALVEDAVGHLQLSGLPAAQANLRQDGAVDLHVQRGNRPRQVVPLPLEVAHRAALEAQLATGHVELEQRQRAADERHVVVVVEEAVHAEQRTLVEGDRQRAPVLWHLQHARPAHIQPRQEDVAQHKVRIGTGLEAGHDDAFVAIAAHPYEATLAVRIHLGGGHRLRIVTLQEGAIHLEVTLQEHHLVVEIRGVTGVLDRDRSRSSAPPARKTLHQLVGVRLGKLARLENLEVNSKQDSEECCSHLRHRLRVAALWQASRCPEQKSKSGANQL